ncbi:MAG TPA: TIGR03960 family B12-binding radical SAM protein [Polyangiaceae bacterium]
MQLFDHPYARFLSKVRKPNRYTGAEHGVVRKDWQGVKARVCLAFPDVYDIGMSHLGFRILYKILNEHAETCAERCYAPWVDMQSELLSHGEFLRSLEGARPLCDFDVVGFSLQYELTYTNVLRMLDLGGIPLRAEHRGDGDPLILMGGPVATHMEPMAPFADAVLIGDGEEAATEIALCWTNAKRLGLDREARLRRIAAIEGVYVPSLYGTEVDAATGLEVVTGALAPEAPFPVKRRLLEDINRFPFPDDGPVGGPEAIFDRMSIEVARGCTEGCRFCQAGMIYRPVRERDPADVVDTVMRALEKSGQDEVSLTSLSTADVSCISPLIKQLVEKTAPERVSLSVASLRAYGLGEDLLDAMRRVRASGLTFAPEAGTQRMRDVINKNVTEAQLMETAERVFSRGYDRMKLYFMLGLPTETEEDLRGIIDVGVNALGVGKRVGKRPQVTVSVSTHVPKPHTPFQWCAMDSLETVQEKQRLLRGLARSYKGLKLRLHDPASSVLEGVLARGDRALGKVIEHAYLAGAQFDSWDDQLKLDVWQKAFEHFGIRTDRYLGTLPVNGARLPWSHIDVGLEPDFLPREYRRALKNRLSPPCSKPKGMTVHHADVQTAEADARKLICYHCGVACDLGAMRDERIGFLRKMGAWEGARAAEASPSLPAPSPRPALIAPERLRPRRAGGNAERFRLEFEKLGPAALLGHLDLIRELPRVIRRAGVRTGYTQGYHPKPNMSFGPALALGVASLGELTDVDLVGAPEPDVLARLLGRASSAGLRFVGAVRLDGGAPTLARSIAAARYVLAVDPDAAGGEALLRRRVEELLARPEARVRRELKGLAKLVDVRQKVLGLAVGGDTARAALERAGVQGATLTLEMELSCDPSGSVRLVEVLEALTGDASLPFLGVRVEFVDRDGKPLHVASSAGRPEHEPSRQSA